MKSHLSRSVLVPLIIATALFMENLDSTVLATALPAIAQSLGTSPLRLNLAITSYLFSLAVFIPVSGWLADRFGARLIFRLAIVIFMLGSILCGLGESVTGFVLARLLQGLGGAMMVPVGRLVLMRSVERHELVRAMTYLTFPALIGPVVGPPVGGFLVTYVSWRWIFWINIPIGLLGILLVTLFIEDVREEVVRPFDFPGFCLTSLGFTGLIFGFEAVGRNVIPNSLVIGLMAGGALSLLLYVLHARRSPHPIIDLSLIRIGTFRAGLVGGFLFRIAIGATPFLLPMMLQVGFGMSAFHSGSLTFAAAAGAMLMKLTAGPILRRFGFRQVLIANALVSAAFILANGLFRPSTPGLLILAILLVGGFFRSLQFTSINALIVADVPRERLSQATTFSAIAQQLSLSFGVGVGALTLHLTVLNLGHGEVTATSFTIPFLVIAAFSALSALTYLSLPRNAGAEVAGQSAAPRETRA